MNLPWADMTAAGASLFRAVDGVDAGVVLVLVGCALFGSFHGFSGEVAGLLTLVGALVGGVYLHTLVFEHVGIFADLPDDAPWIPALVFAVILLLLILAMFLLRRLLRGGIRLVVDQPADALLGAAAGAVRGGIIIFLVFAAVSLAPETKIHSLFLEKSRAGKLLKPFLLRARSCFESFPPPAAPRGKNGRGMNSARSEPPTPPTPTRLT